MVEREEEKDLLNPFFSKHRGAPFFQPFLVFFFRLAELLLYLSDFGDQDFLTSLFVRDLRRLIFKGKLIMGLIAVRRLQLRIEIVSIDWL